MLLVCRFLWRLKLTAEQHWLVFGLSVRNPASSKTGIHTQPVPVAAVGHLLSCVTFDRLYTLVDCAP